MAGKPKTRLTNRQEAFVSEYVKDLNATQAVIRAGYKTKAPWQTGYRLLQDPAVQKRLTHEAAEKARRNNVDADWVIQNLVQVVKRCMQEEAVLDKEGNRTGEFRLDSAGANRALELLGRHFNAWDKDQAQVPAAQFIFYLPKPLTKEEAMAKHGFIELKQNEAGSWTP